MQENLQEWSQRPQRYWYVDGLSEIGAGAVIFFFGLFSAVVGLLPAGGYKGLLLGIGQPALVIGLAVLARWAVARLKDRITYPRTGYIAYRRAEPRKRIGGILLAAGISAGIGLVVFISRNWLNLRWLPAITGGFAALLTLLIALRIRLPRFYLLTGYTLFVGVVTGLLRLADPYDTALFFGGLGIGWILSGAFTLAGYLRRTKPADLPLDEGEAG